MAPFDDLLTPSRSIDRLGLIVERGSNGVLANVFPIHQFSTAGFDCGTLNDGTSDLSLSVLHTLIPPVPASLERAHEDADDLAYRRLETDPALWSKWLRRASCRVSLLAWKLHCHFAADVVARLDRDGGHVPIADLRGWIQVWTPVVRTG